MKLIIKLFGMMILLSGIALLIKPEVIVDRITHNVESTALYIAAIVIRLVFGVFCIVAAKKSNYPRIIKCFGYLFIIVAIIFIAIGHACFQHIITSLIFHLKPFTPLGGLLSIGWGGFLIYAFSRKRMGAYVND